MGFESSITPASDVSNTEGSLYFITGAPGAGKTTLIASLDDIPEYKGRILFLDAGGGLRAISDRPTIAKRRIEKWSVLEEARAYLDKGKHPYLWVVVDLVTEAYGICLAETAAAGSVTTKGRATLEARGIANDLFVKMVRDYRILAETKGINVVFTSHTQETKDDDSGMILVRPNLTPGTLSTVIGIVDVAAYLDIKKGKRLLYLVGNDRIWAKAKKPLSYGTVAETIESPTFAKILKELSQGGDA